MRKSHNLTMFATRPPRRTALTLLELLAATLLAAMLMAALLGVLKGMTASEKSLVGTGPADAWQSRLVERLEWDLTNSRTIQSSASGFRLTGFAARDFQDGTPILSPAVIEYAIFDADGITCLARRETHFDAMGFENGTGELVCTGVDGIVVAPAASDGANQTIHNLPRSSDKSDARTISGNGQPVMSSTMTNELADPSKSRPPSISNGPLPARLSVMIFLNGETTPHFSHAFLLH